MKAGWSPGAACEGMGSSIVLVSCTAVHKIAEHTNFANNGGGDPLQATCVVLPSTKVLQCSEVV